MLVAKVKIWDEFVGAILWNEDKGYASFEYDKSFLSKGLDLSPIMMPISQPGIFSFPLLNKETYKGLPGLLADSLPDKYGNKLIDAWLSRQGKDPISVNAVERLCYIGKRGMGALEFEPALVKEADRSHSLEIEELIKLAQELLEQKEGLKTNLRRKRDEAILDIISVGTSAGGARAKAIIAYNEETGEVRSGQIKSPSGFDYWLVKFDGVTNKKLGDPAGYGRIEYAYYKMATDCGIKMMRSFLLKENKRAHFMTKRFDRDNNRKLHMQTLCALAHYDYNDSGSYSYEQAFQVMRTLRLSYKEMEQLYIRMVFNVMARNQDDHTKNISFLMNNKGSWSLSPAYDMTFAYDPANKWMHNHQLSVNGKRTGITSHDLIAVAGSAGIKKPAEIIQKVKNTVADWKEYAEKAEVPDIQAKEIGKTHLLKI